MISMIFEGNSREVIALLSKLNDSRFRVANALMAKDYNGLKVESSKGTERMSLFVMNKDDEVFLKDCDLPTLKIGENKTYDGLMFELKPFLENIRKTLPSLSISVAILYKVADVERWSFAYTYVPHEVFSIVENTNFERKSKKEIVKVPYSFKCESCGEENSLNMNENAEKVFCSVCGKEHLVSKKINLGKETIEVKEDKHTQNEKGMTVTCPICGEEVIIGFSLLKSMSSSCNLKCKKCGNKYSVKNPYAIDFDAKINNLFKDFGISNDVKEKVFNEVDKAKEDIKGVLPKSAEETLDSVVDALNECFGLKIDKSNMPKMPEDIRAFFRDLLD